MRWKGSAIVLAMCVVAALLASTTKAADGAKAGGAVIGTGKLRGVYWAVEAFPDGHRKGICFSLLFGNRHRPNGESVQCSAPAEKQGIFLDQKLNNRHTSDGAVAIVGMALNAAVAKVEVTTCSGNVETLHPKQPHGPGSGLGHIADYRYVAYAVPGPWCAQEIATYDKAGEILLEDGFAN